MRGPAETDLRNALVEFRRELVKEISPNTRFVTPQALLATELLDRIVDLAHHQRISTIDELRAQITWGFTNTHGHHVVNLAQQFCPPPVLSTPFTRDPLQQASQGVSTTRAISGTKQKVQRACKECGEPGHYRESVQSTR